jgi:hypothetical protein
MTIFLTFVFLQICDILTTLLLLHRGGAEANPLVRAAMRLAQPAVALVLLKFAACGLAWLAWSSRRVRLLRRVNWLFAACIAWNLVAIAVA